MPNFEQILEDLQYDDLTSFELAEKAGKRAGVKDPKKFAQLVNNVYQANDNLEFYELLEKAYEMVMR